jgi:uncharacterized protein
MSFSLYSATIPAFSQTLESVLGLLEKGAAFCKDKGLAPQEIIGAQLAPDMFPFAYQVKSTAVHSLGAIEGVRRGVFSPDLTPPPADFESLKSQVAGALGALKAVDAAEIDAFMGRDMRFEFRDMRMDFTAENFLLSFSLPNFYFHTTTAYSILRWKGVAVGKRDYLGRLRLKQ